MKILLTVLSYIIPILVGYFLVKLFNRFTDHLQKIRPELKGNLGLAVLRSVIIAIIWAGAVVGALSNNKNFTKLWETVLTSASVLGVVMGLAAQETLGNVFSGIALSLGESRPFNLGDRVRIGDTQVGIVRNITIRHVELETYLGERIFIPNSVAASSVVVNYTRAGDIGQTIDVSVAYDTDLEHARKVMADVIRSHPLYQGGEPSVLCREAGESGILLRAVIMTKDFANLARVSSECLAEIIRRFDREGIEIPYNKLEILQNQVTLVQKKAGSDLAQ